MNIIEKKIIMKAIKSIGVVIKSILDILISTSIKVKSFILNIFSRIYDILKKVFLWFLIISLLYLILLLSINPSLAPSWFGIYEDPIPLNMPGNYIIIHQQSKTLWDWLQLLLVPIILILGGFWLNRSESRHSLEMQKSINDTNLSIEKERFEDGILNSYINDIAQMIINSDTAKLRTNRIMAVYKIKTLTTLNRLNSERRNYLIQFLVDSKMLNYWDFLSDFKNIHVSGIFFNDVSFDDFKFIGSSISSSRFFSCSIQSSKSSHSDFTSSMFNDMKINIFDISSSKFIQSSLVKVIFSECKIKDSKFYGSKIQHSSLGNSTIESSDLSCSTISNTNFSDTKFYCCDFIRSSIKDSSFIDVDFWNVNFSNTELINVTIENLISPEVKGTPNNIKLIGSTLKNVKMIDSHLLNFDFSGAFLENVDFTGSNITRNQIEKAAKYINITFPS